MKTAFLLIVLLVMSASAETQVDGSSLPAEQGVVSPVTAAPVPAMTDTPASAPPTQDSVAPSVPQTALPTNFDRLEGISPATAAPIPDTSLDSFSVRPETANAPSPTTEDARPATAAPMPLSDVVANAPPNAGPTGPMTNGGGMLPPQGPTRQEGGNPQMGPRMPMGDGTTGDRMNTGGVGGQQPMTMGGRREGMDRGGQMRTGPGPNMQPSPDRGGPIGQPETAMRPNSPMPNAQQPSTRSGVNDQMGPSSMPQPNTIPGNIGGAGNGQTRSEAPGQVMPAPNPVTPAPITQPNTNRGTPGDGANGQTSAPLTPAPIARPNTNDGNMAGGGNGQVRLPQNPTTPAPITPPHTNTGNLVGEGNGQAPTPVTPAPITPPNTNTGATGGDAPGQVRPAPNVVTPAPITPPTTNTGTMGGGGNGQAPTSVTPAPITQPTTNTGTITRGNGENGQLASVAPGTQLPTGNGGGGGGGTGGQTGTTTTQTTPNSAQPSINPTGEWQKDMLQLVNKERSNAGLKDLCINSKLSKAANDHAADMAAKGYFSHTSQDGRSPTDRMRAAGFAGGATAENIAQGQPDVAAVMKTWMNSEGHKANILGANYNMAGFGLSGGNWVQTFGGSTADQCEGETTTKQTTTQTPAPATQPPATAPPTKPPTTAPPATTQPPPTAPPATTQPPTKPTAVPEWETDMLKLINQERANASLKPLCINSKLNEAANDHAVDMATKGYFSHTSPDGRSPGDRMKAKGFSDELVAENIAQGDVDVASVMKTWMGSDGHKANILGTNYNLAGFGHSGDQWVQTFGGSNTEQCVQTN